jgi:hypothetical protein
MTSAIRKQFAWYCITTQKTVIDTFTIVGTTNLRLFPKFVITFVTLFKTVAVNHINVEVTVHEKCVLCTKVTVHQ